jgi:hypothetical protein
MVAVATIRRAIDALCAAQADDGSFRDFALGIGASGPWVTAHVGGRLAGLPPRYRDDRVTGAAARAMRYLDGATWSYNEHAPADADTIAHALILAGALGERRPDAALALAGHQTADGGFATFVAGAPGADFASWTRSHPDVTPVAVRALAAYRDLAGLDDVIARAVARGAADRLAGARAFWWDLDWYTRAMWIDAYAALALAFDAGPAPVAPAPRTLLDAAYLLAIACAAGWDALIDELADHLLGAATPGGLWPASRALRVVAPDIAQPWLLPGETGGALYADVEGIYSTAVIASVLAAWWR